MPQTSMTTILNNIYMPGANSVGHIVINEERIESTWPGLSDHPDAINCHGATALPGAIDIHVHFREPGMTHKGTIASESRAAVAGGVTSFVDMPNVRPASLTNESLAERMVIAERTSSANYGFWLGASAEMASEIASADYSRVAGVKLFLGSSTGGLLVSTDYDISRVLEAVPEDIVVSVHAEDNGIIDECRRRIIDMYGPDPEVRFHSQIRPTAACVHATERILRLASRYNTRIHIAHVSTADELSLFSAGSPNEKRVTCEVSPHHLLWCDEDYATRGARIKMNPSVKSRADRDALRRAVTEGRIDVIATDHAPHLSSEKKGGAMSAMSGAPMVQFSYAAMTDMFGPAKASLLMAENPARLLGIEGRGIIAPGKYADIVLAQETAPYPVTDSDVISTCGWTPLAPESGNGSPFLLRTKISTVAINGFPAKPQALRFNNR